VPFPTHTPPPSSTLFPYTTLFRSRYYSVADYDLAKAEDSYRAALDLDPNESVALNNLALLYIQERRFAVAESLVAHGLANPHPRSEEHTSELQSLRHLVCRLLLEK